ncbi:hypothetical protein ACWC1D_27525 [Streptomyces sp. NPDC001478]
MNPYDQSERPGAHLVAERLGVDSPWRLTGNYAPDDVRDLVGQLIAEHARDVDALHKQLASAARSAAERLVPVCRGEIDPDHRYGVLESLAPQIDVLSARRAASYDHLTRSITTFIRLDHDRPAAGHEQTAPNLNEVHSAAHEPGPVTVRTSAALSRSSTPSSTAVTGPSAVSSISTNLTPARSRRAPPQPPHRPNPSQ